MIGLELTVGGLELIVGGLESNVIVREGSGGRAAMFKGRREMVLEKELMESITLVTMATGGVISGR